MNLRFASARKVFVLLMALVSFHAEAGEILLPAHSVWKFLAITNDAGTDWREPGYDDSAWWSGRAQLGYGDEDEITIVPFYYDAIGLKNISTYFRCKFSVTNAAGFTNLLFGLLRDDGAVVYLNGVEVFRDNMPTGVITHATLALTSISSPEENTVFVPRYATPSALRDGTNVLAVELHQVGGTSADTSFDLELIGNAPASRPPVVTFTAPAPGAVLTAGASAWLDVSASDPDGSVERVEFFIDATRLGEATTPPFSFTWSNLPVGLHLLSARATDNTGVQSDPDTLLVRAGGYSLVSTGATWRYLDDQTEPPANWTQRGYDDSGWSNGVAQFGFGDGDEATALRWTIAGTPIVTAYFRKEFVSPDPSHFAGLMLRLLRDDGGVVYLNGIEVFRSNMPGGEVHYGTYALSSVNTGPQESTTYFPTNLPPGVLVEGTNIIAAEIHQITQFSSTDMSFDAELTAFPSGAATRLSTRRDGGSLVLSWPGWSAGFSLESSAEPLSAAKWTTTTNVREHVGNEWTVTVPADGTVGRFFRLRLE